MSGIALRVHLKTLPNTVSRWVPRQMPTLHELTLDGTIETSVVDEANWRTRINPEVEPGYLSKFVLARFSF